jgi:hypothetical protein
MVCVPRDGVCTLTVPRTIDNVAVFMSREANLGLRRPTDLYQSLRPKLGSRVTGLASIGIREQLLRAL